ncbi:poly-beta-1,6-N-acetyl-D-glucosamine biosynthesis protein PgaD [Luteibacter sp. HA06]|jgi:poly-beta-1,6-N-acetyl-D-glucosamine biosynthesis protein PgaD
MKAETILIDQPEKQSLPRRVLYGILTVLAWLLWGLLWLPALHRLASQLNMPVHVERWIPGVVLSGTHELADIVWLAPLSLLVFLAWSLYEGRRKRGQRQRRRRPGAVPLPDAAESLGATTAQARCIQDSRRAVLSVDDDGHIGVTESDATANNVVSLNAETRRRA